MTTAARPTHVEARVEIGSEDDAETGVEARVEAGAEARVEARVEAGVEAGVGRTALLVAAARAIETHRADALARDPYAEHFVRAAAASATWPVRPADVPGGDADPLWGRLGRYFALRTRAFDDFLLDRAAAGVRQIALLGAGLDTRALRLAWPPGTAVYELDRPAVLTFKHRVLDSIAPTPNPAHRADDRATPKAARRGDGRTAANAVRRGDDRAVPNVARRGDDRIAANAVSRGDDRAVPNVARHDDDGPDAVRRPVAVDLADDWARPLLAAGFDPAAPTAWLAEGLLLYLSRAAERRLIAAVDDLSAPGSALAYEAKVGFESGKIRANPVYTAARERVGVDLLALFDAEPRPDSAADLTARGWTTTVRTPFDFTRRHGRGPLPEPDDALAANRWTFAEKPAP
ncbi:SAM-dependent methyltransferase [Actinomadura atramentaria]|uniref:SAM-dependent methyltransferase n=1 Tax=Actinomadura atramentaria TaxID=1990 RepID=UPI00036E758B|nr:SAM-dependent methyltransferase [Actinomadura atramentaria]